MKEALRLARVKAMGNVTEAVMDHLQSINHVQFRSEENTPPPKMQSVACLEAKEAEETRFNISVSNMEGSYIRQLTIIQDTPRLTRVLKLFSSSN
eukprot:365769-Chlamydomonas_euryale.AAC.5